MHKRTSSSDESTVAKFRKINESSLKLKKEDIPSTSKEAVPNSDDEEFMFVDVKDADSEEVSTNSDISEELGETLDKARLKELNLNDRTHLDRMANQPTVNKLGKATALQQIVAALGRLESRQKEILKRLVVIENALDMKMPECLKVQVNNQLVGKYTEDLMSDEQTFLLNMLPISSDETLLKVEEHLKDKVYTDAMVDIIFQLKTSKKIIEKVLKSLFSDKLVYHYNFGGKAGKKPLTKLKIVDLVLAAFASVRIDKIAAIRRYISLSHNRYKQFKRNSRRQKK